MLTLGIKLGEGEGFEEGMTDIVGAGVDLLLLLLLWRRSHQSSRLPTFEPPSLTPDMCVLAPVCHVMAIKSHV